MKSVGIDLFTSAANEIRVRAASDVIAWSRLQVISRLGKDK